MSATIRKEPPQETLLSRYRRVRECTLALCDTLQPEDTVVQSMPEVSPTKWHLAHTTWFFEQFVLSQRPHYQPLHADWLYLFNSYYQSIGPMHTRPQRGLLSRPTFKEVRDYRRHVDERMQQWLEATDDEELQALVTLGLNHEQQHQELLLTDIKHVFSVNPLQPVFCAAKPTLPGSLIPLSFLQGHEGITKIGDNGTRFAFDNEKPRHRVVLHPHALANRLVTNAEFLEFIRDGGYHTPALWMAEGWIAVQEHGWSRPLYWSGDLQSAFTLAGPQPIDPQAPVCHVSFYEADAFARWAGMRLPTEAEWESAAVAQPMTVGNFLEDGYLQPCAPTISTNTELLQLFGNVWEWTSSPYINYPGFRPLAGALGEYNGKFMCGQWVLRGGSCVTPTEHIRATYRNFFYPADRWQFMGIRLARDV